MYQTESVNLDGKRYTRTTYEDGSKVYGMQRGDGRFMMLDARHSKAKGRIDLAIENSKKDKS